MKVSGSCVDLRSALAAATILCAGCITVQHAPESMQKEQLLVRVWVDPCSAEALRDRTPESDRDCATDADGRRIQGAVIAFHESALTLLAWQESDPAVTISTASVLSVQLYRGRVPSAKAALEKAAIGALMGAALGAASGAIIGGMDPWLDAGDAALQGMAAGAGIGAVSGALAGIFEGDDHWEKLPLASLRTLYCHTNERARCSESEGNLAARIAVEGR
jgi:hypothetical protein